MNRQIVVTLTTYNRLEILKQCFQSLKENSGMDFHFIVSSTSSIDGTDEWLIEQYSNNLIDVLLLNKNNFGLSYNENQLTNLACVNSIAKKWNPEIICLFGDDYVYNKNWLVDTISFMDKIEEEDNIAMLSILKEPEYSWAEITSTINRGGVEGYIRNSITGCSLVFKRGWVDKILKPDGFNTETIVGGEDTKLVNHVKSKGYKMVALDMCQNIGFGKSTYNFHANAADPNYSKDSEFFSKLKEVRDKEKNG